MFRRKSRSSQTLQPLTAETASSNATSAALSAAAAAAAAAALGAHPATPTNVADVETDRMRRRASLSSTRSRSRSHSSERRGRPGAEGALVRQGSSSSMRDRTFRSPSPSPHRSPRPGGGGREDDVPPVPKLPDNVQSHGKPGKRSVSLQSQPFRVASQKGSKSKGSWYGPATTGHMDDVRAADAPPKGKPSASLSIRPVSPSVNFSYPRSPDSAGFDTRQRSPPPTESPDHQTMVFDPNTRRMVSRTELLAKDQALRAASERPAPTRKKQQQQHQQQQRPHLLGKTGSQPAKSTVGRTRSSTGERKRPVISPVQTKKRPSSLEIPRASADPIQNQATAPKERSIPHVTKPTEKTPADTKVEPPPIVEEEKESEESEPEPPVAELEVDSKAAAKRNVLEKPAGPSITSAPVAPADRTLGESPVELDARPSRQDAQHASSENPHSHLTHRSEASPERRSLSRSPARSARFAPTPTPEHLNIRHAPPARSISPRKSALKHSSPTRGLSDDSSEASRDDAPVSRKKSVRVSFDDDCTVVGEAAETTDPDSTQAPAPSSPRRWFTLGRHKRDLAPLDEDEAMKPRPALPLFSSVREMKPKESDERERPLVRPQSFGAPAAQQLSTTYGGHSTDEKIGSLLANQPSKHEASNHKNREPLPPVVTSVEGPSYISHSSTDEEVEEEEDDDDSLVDSLKDPKPEPEPGPASAETPHKNAATSPPNGLKLLPMPSLIVSTQPSSPEHIEVAEEPANTFFFDVPGHFPDDDAISNTTASAADTAKNNTAPAPAPRMSTEPSTSTVASTAFSGTTAAKDSESDSESSIYSDAYEDLSDMEAGGFMSLDAVVATPIDAEQSQKLYEVVMTDSPDGGKAATASSSDPPLAKSMESTDDWDKVKAYWKSLTAEKRKQLEMEALDEAGEDGDLDQDQQPKKPKRKKSVDQKQQMRIALQRANPERTYQIRPGTKVPDHLESVDAGTARQVQVTDKTARVSMMRSTMRGTPQSSVSSPAAEASRAPTTPRFSVSTPDAPEPRGFRKSMRASPLQHAPQPVDGKLRRPMRLNAPSQLDGGQRSASATSSLPLSSRQPASSSPDLASTPLGHGKNAALLKAGTVPMRRRNSDSSESSFTRARSRPSRNGFLKTMRGASASDVRPLSADGMGPAGRPRFDLHSMSASESPDRPRRPPISLDTAHGMRHSLRNNSNDGASHRIKMPLLRRKKNKNKFSSRFDYSSDEDEPKPLAFRSRFDDSSDDDEPSIRPRVGRHIVKTMRPGPGPGQTVRTESPALAASNKARESQTPATARPPAPVALGSRAERRSHGRTSVAGATVGPYLDATDNEDHLSGDAGDQARAHHPSSAAVDDDIAQLQRKRSNRVPPKSIASRPLGAQVLDSDGQGGSVSTTGAADSAANGESKQIAPVGQGRRSGIMSVLGRRKPDPPGTIYKINRNGDESAARRDTVPERSADKLAAVRRESPTLILQQQGSRAGPSRSLGTSAMEQNGRSLGDGNWPLQSHPVRSGDSDEDDKAAAVPIDAAAGPKELEAEKRVVSESGSSFTAAASSSSTAAVTATPNQPAFPRRRSTSSGLVKFGRPATSGGDSLDPSATGKKRRFSGLRKVFGLEN